MSLSSLKPVEDSLEVARRDVAACYRLMAMHGFVDLTDGFVATRNPGRAGEVVIGAYGALPNRVRASELLLRPLSDNPPIEKNGGADCDAIRFAAAAFEASEEINAVIHAHSMASMVFSSMELEIEPISQAGLQYYNKCAFVNFDENVSGPQAKIEILSAIKNGAKALVLQNHGLLVPGATVADAFVRLYRLDKAMAIQLEAIKVGAPRISADPSMLEEWSDIYWENTDIDTDGGREWPALIDHVRLEDPSFEH